MSASAVKLIKDNIELVKASPVRAILGFGALIPALSLSAAILVLLVGMSVEALLVLLFYGLSGLDRPFEMLWYRRLYDIFMGILSFFTPVRDLTFKVALVIPYSIAAAFLLVSAQEQLDRRKGNNR